MCAGRNGEMMPAERRIIDRMTPKEGRAMRSVILTLAGLVCSVLWLGLLVATRFNAIPVGLGLLTVVYLSGASAGPTHHATHLHRH
jgi:hypothetical protein